MLTNMQYTVITCRICGQDIHISKLQEHLLMVHQMYYAGYNETIDTNKLEVPCQKERPKPKNKKKE